jgi:hypothetical protein
LTSHALIERLKYLWKAKTPHGVHSPFVFDFMAHVLKSGVAAADVFPALPQKGKNASGMSSKYVRVVNRIAAVYGYTQPTFLPDDTEEEPVSSDFILMTAEPKVWIRLFHRYHPGLKAKSCVVIANIHKTRRHTGKWNRLCSHPKVKMSIDLYGIGILFFKEDFREKQHFILSC